MRALLIAAVLLAGCSHPVDKTAYHFCTNVMIMFEKNPYATLSVARESVSAGRCQMLNQTRDQLTTTMLTFEATALPFRDRPEVRRTLDALDKLPMTEVLALNCDDQVRPSQEQIDALLPKIDQVRSKLAAVSAACESE